MWPIIAKISYTAVEALAVGLGVGGALALIRKLQIAFGAHDHNEDRRIHAQGS